MDCYYRYGNSTAVEDGPFDIQVDHFPFWGDEREFLLMPYQDTVMLKEVQQSGLTFQWFRDHELDLNDPVTIILKSQLWLTQKQREAKSEL